MKINGSVWSNGKIGTLTKIKCIHHLMVKGVLVHTLIYKFIFQLRSPTSINDHISKLSKLHKQLQKFYNCKL